ncbi:MAG: leucine--tRNA ligase [Flavobacteriaceae bacterium]|nr:leucine--tRNA ligase [Flavobacteriaceae bacterium]
MQYKHQEIEKKWQEYWANNQTFKASEDDDKPKYYVLDMFPYPSGAGLHVGHPLGYIATDIYARYKRHKGFQVLHPQGYDSFGLPAEQYAIQTGQHPAKTTEENIATYRRQLDQIGFSFDWSREVRTSNPEYYKWTQWIFIQLFNSWYNKDTDKAEAISSLITKFEASGNYEVNAACNDGVGSFTVEDWNSFSDDKKQKILLQYRLTFLSETEVNWCPALGTVLANDEIVNGVSERGGHPVIRKKMTQWSMRISAYAQRLLDGLHTIDWPQPLKDAQTNWIGRSQGAMVSFKVDGYDDNIEVFTTRPDTIFGVSFMTLAPEHELVAKITTTKQKAAVEAYIDATAKRSERDRMADVKTISGVFTGAYAIHPFSGEKVQIWIGDYVLASYGTGAVMAVPCGDQRDYDFAKHFGIEIPNIFEGVDISDEAYTDKEKTVITNSDFLNGLSYKKAMKTVINELEQQGIGYGKINYRLRDAVFSRQRYWGEPFPVYYVDGMPQMISDEHLPIVLPQVEKYLPTEDGRPPLGNAEVWAWDTRINKVVENIKIDHKTVFPLELNTMPGWAGSSQYFNRYMDPRNTKEIFSKEAIEYWQQVDLYIGGSEHATGHLLYARFWQKFMFDKGLVPVDEFAKKLLNQGMILGTSAIIHRVSGTNQYVSKRLKENHETDKLRVDVKLINSSDELDIEALKNWQPQFSDAEFILEDDRFIVGREVEKMSKRWFNVVNPDDICEEYGADALRLFEMFLGPLEQSKPWKTSGISGVYSFLKKLWKLYHNGDIFKVVDVAPTKDELKTLHKTIKKVEEDIENFSFNTSVSTFMIAVNELTAQKCCKRAILEPLLVLISPYAPHIAEELWEKLGNTSSISTAAFPVFEEKFLVETSKKYPISFNGKTRFMLELPSDMSQEAIEKTVMAHEKTQAQLQGRIPKKVIVVPGRIVNIVG